MKKWMKTALVLAAAVCLSVAAAFTALAAQTFQITASIGSCLIGSGQNTVDISLSSNGDTTGTDGKIICLNCGRMSRRLEAGLIMSAA